MVSDPDVVEAKKQNDDYVLEITDAAVGDVKIDYEIRGNEYQADRLYSRIITALQEQKEEFGPADGGEQA